MTAPAPHHLAPALDAASAAGGEGPLVRIVDDDPSLRSSMAFMLRQEGLETAEYPSAHAFLSADVPSRPGCLLLDVKMPEMTGLELQEEMIRRGMSLPIVFLSAHGDIDMAVDAMQRGAVAFVQKTADRTRLLDAVYRAIERSAGSGPGPDPAEAVARWRSLTARERDVAALIAEGLLNREVGERLGGISVKTVQVHRGEVCRKLGVRGAAGITQAVRRVKRLLGDCDVGGAS